MIDVAIIGGGPAGLSAAIYCSRSGLQTVIFEKYFAGGQITISHLVENYPGISDVSGSELGMKFEEHAKKFGTTFIMEDVLEVIDNGKTKTLRTSQGVYEAKAIILSMGASPRLLGIENEEKFRGAGVSYCATCDGAFYKNRTVAVIGGGNVAFEDAAYLSKICKKVYLIHRSEKFSAEKIAQDLVFNSSNIQVIKNTIVNRITGEFDLKSITIENIFTKETEELMLDGIFVAIGYTPNSTLVKDLVEMNDLGYIKTDKFMATSVKGIYAAGDIRDNVFRQVVVAASDGAIASYAVSKYINENIW